MFTKAYGLKIFSIRTIMNRVFPFVLLAMSADILANDFVAPLPPPELGENLTNYRTQQQRQESRSSESNSSSSEQSKVLQDNRQVLIRNGSSKPNSSSQQEKTLMKEVVVENVYVPNRMIPVYTGGETLLYFKNYQSGDKLKVKSVVVSNSGFLGRKTDDYTVTITPTGMNTAAKVKVELDNGKVIVLVLSYKSFKREIRHIEYTKL